MSRTDTIWITGVGAATPLGSSYQTIADNVLAGKSAIAPVDIFDAKDHLCKLYAPVQPIPVPADWEEAAFRRLDRVEQMLLWCASQALRDGGWWERRGEVRVGLVLGLGAEWLRTWELDRWTREAGASASRSWTWKVMEPTCSASSAYRGPRATVAAACASGNYALSQARQLAENGLGRRLRRRVVQRGRDPDEPGRLRQSRRPVETQRRSSGGVQAVRSGPRRLRHGRRRQPVRVGSSASARRRGARPYGELAGFGASSDAFHMVIPSSDPEPCVKAMREALTDAALNPDEISYINAHATSTPLGDAAEARVLQTVLGEAVHKVSVSSTKSMTGHLLGRRGRGRSSVLPGRHGAAGAAADDQSVQSRLRPAATFPTTPGRSRSSVTVSNSFGFGGSNTCLVLRKVG